MLYPCEWPKHCGANEFSILPKVINNQNKKLALPLIFIKCILQKRYLLLSYKSREEIFQFQFFFLYKPKLKMKV